MATALRAVARGSTFGEGFVTVGSASLHMKTWHRTHPTRLSAKETEIMRLLESGLPVKGAAARMHIADSTMRKYLQRIRDKMHVACTEQAVVLWMKGWQS